MNFFKKYCFLVIVYLTVAPSIAAAEKLPEDDFEGFRNKGMHNFFEKFSQGNFLDLGFESLTENQQREEAGKEERELKKQAEEASRQERKQEKRRQAIETENKLKVFQELLEESQTKLTGAEAEKTQIMQQRNLANEKVKESEKLLKEFQIKLTVAEEKELKLFTQLVGRGNEEIYRRFLNGVLIYRPDGKSDEGRINLPIASLVNPLEGTFDLSQCGDTGQYMSISTGYRKGKKAENANKLEIWFTPRFLVENELQGTASHFQEIFPAKWKDNAPVGIIWTWGGRDNCSDNFDYLTMLTIEEISNNNLQDVWARAVRADAVGRWQRERAVESWCAGGGGFIDQPLHFFMFIL